MSSVAHKQPMNDTPLTEDGRRHRATVRTFTPRWRNSPRVDAMMEYLKFTGSALFAMPPGPAEGEYIGQPLFG